MLTILLQALKEAPGEASEKVIRYNNMFFKKYFVNVQRYLFCVVQPIMING